MSPFATATSKAADFPSPIGSSFRRFAVGLIAFAAIPPLALAALIVLVDPYYVFGTPNIPGINAVRPLYENHVPTVKPYQVRRINPDAIILGSSRAEVGLDPRHPGWAGKNVFNFGLPSASSYEVMLALLHAQALQHPMQAIVGLDFFAYNAFYLRNQDYLEARFSGDDVKAFADFLASELAKRRHDVDSKPTSSEAASAPKETAREETQPVPPEEIAADANNPPAKWNEALYLRLHPDVAAEVKRGTFVNGYHHYLAAGRAEGRQSGVPPLDWNDELYLRIYPDVAAEVRRGTFVNGYHHYLAAGRAEGRQSGTPPREWNDAQYLRTYPDVAAEVKRGTFASGYHHYVVAGRAEGRETGTPPPDWNEALYLAINADVRDEIARGTFHSGHHHFLAAGKSEHRDGGFIPREWNDLRYRQVNHDVDSQITQRRFLNGYHHYLTAGRAEGRTGGFVPDGWDDAQYLKHTPAARVRLALGEYIDGYAHYAAAGKKQGLPGGFAHLDIADRLRLQWPRFGKAVFQASELLHLVFSMTVVNDTLATLTQQSDPAAFNNHGMRVWDSQPAVLRGFGGAGYIFRENLIRGQWGLWLMPPHYKYCFNRPDTEISGFDPFRFMLRRAHEQNTDLRLFMTPLHTVVRQVFVAIGLGDRYEFWQRELVRINEEEAARAGRKPFPIWDFSDSNSITREPVPAATDLTTMRWYWEYSHYRNVTGNLILDRILEHTDAERTLPADFGVRLTADTVDAHLARSKAGFADWVAANPEFAMQILTLPRQLKATAINRQAQANCW